jgi:Replication-relaxation
MSDENPPIPQKRRGSRGVGRPIQLQERDLDILYSLSVGRYLTVLAIEWLHYPGWRERYKAHIERQRTDEALCYRPLNHIYRRLVAMRAGESPLVYRLTRATERARLAYERLADAYVLAEAGAELLSIQRGYELSDLWYEDPRKRSIKNFEHSVAIGTCYAALRSSLEFAGQQLTDWRGDHLLARRDVEQSGPSYDRVRVSWVGKDGKLKAEDVAILPDATFTLNDGRYFIEIDRGTTNLESWAEKVRAYEAYRRSPRLLARYATGAFTVLVVAPTENRLKRIAEEMIKIAKQPGSGYLFTTADKIHPVRIRANWRRLVSVEWKTRKVIDRLVEFPDQLRFASHALWKNPEL